MQYGFILYGYGLFYVAAALLVQRRVVVLPVHLAGGIHVGAVLQQGVHMPYELSRGRQMDRLRAKAIEFESSGHLSGARRAAGVEVELLLGVGARLEEPLEQPGAVPVQGCDVQGRSNLRSKWKKAENHGKTRGKPWF